MTAWTRPRSPPRCAAATPPAIEFDDTGQISHLTAIYDSSILSDTAYRSLVGLAAEAPLCGRRQPPAS